MDSSRQTCSRLIICRVSVLCCKLYFSSRAVSVQRVPPCSRLYVEREGELPVWPVRGTHSVQKVFGGSVLGGVLLSFSKIRICDVKLGRALWRTGVRLYSTCVVFTCRPFQVRGGMPGG